MPMMEWACPGFEGLRAKRQAQRDGSAAPPQTWVPFPPHPAHTTLSCADPLELLSILLSPWCLRLPPDMLPYPQDPPDKTAGAGPVIIITRRGTSVVYGDLFEGREEGC